MRVGGLTNADLGTDDILRRIRTVSQDVEERDGTRTKACSAKGTKTIPTETHAPVRSKGLPQSQAYFLSEVSDVYRTNVAGTITAVPTRPHDNQAL